MRVASSPDESTLSNIEMAQETDRRLLFVAQNLPPHAFKGADGESIVVCQQLEVGELSCTNTGLRTMEVTVKLYGDNDCLGFWKEYGLPHGALARPRERVDLIDSGSISASEFDDCPDKEAFMRGFDVLFTKFVTELPVYCLQAEADQQHPDNVVSLADHQAA